jgi:hypothetical protein
MILGHSTLSTIEIYTQVSFRKFKDIHKATHSARVKEMRQADYESRRDTDDGITEVVLETLGTDYGADPE